MKPRNALILVAASSLLLLGSRRDDIEAADGDITGGLSLDTLGLNAEAIMNQLMETPAMVDSLTAQRNIAAGLKVIQLAEGTAGQADPYRVCYGYRHTIGNLGNHPAITGEWRGEKLPDEMCRNAGFGPGCVSTAAGAYQITKGTWLDVAAKIGATAFTPAWQDAAAIELIRRNGALEDLKADRLVEAMHKVRGRWASLPGNYAKQGQRSAGQLLTWFAQAGGRAVA